MKTVSMSGGEITLLLKRARDGERHCLDQVFERLYPELRRMAQARIAFGERTLSPTALVHESYVRLAHNQGLSLTDRNHFMACAARAMRAVVVDHLRAATADKRGGGAATITLSAALGQAQGQDLDLLALDGALNALDHIDSAQRELVELHFFAGLEFQQIAQMRGIHEKTVRRHWQRARAFLRAQLSGNDVE